MEELKQTPSKQRYTAKRFVKDSTILAMRGLGYMLTFFFLSLLAMLTYSFVHDICGFYSSVKHNSVVSNVLLITGILISLNTLFNFLMASFTKPGGTQHLKYLANNLEERCEHALLRINNDVDSEDEEDLEKNSITKGKICLKCKSFKPLRSHHCSICNSCVLRMDHHCPWINNCVGHQNHRYYLLLLTYLTIGTGFYALTGLSVRLSPELKQYKMTTMFDLMFLFCFVIFAVIFPFTSWHWYLAMTGQTTIEFAERKTFSGQKELLQNHFYDFRQTKISQNLEYIFGTKSFFKIFFSCLNCKTLDHEGVDWDDYINKS